MLKRWMSKRSKRSVQLMRVKKYCLNLQTLWTVGEWVMIESKQTQRKMFLSFGWLLMFSQKKPGKFKQQKLWLRNDCRLSREKEIHIEDNLFLCVCGIKSPFLWTFWKRRRRRRRKTIKHLKVFYDGFHCEHWWWWWWWWKLSYVSLIMCYKPK